MKHTSALLSGCIRAAPIVLGYVPIGLAFGVLARSSGLTTGAVLGMSLMLYAGSAQFLAVGMIAGGAGFLPITIATFFINLRHLLMSAALAPHLRRHPLRKLAFFAHELTDESFALHSTAFQKGLCPSLGEMVSLNATAQIAWVASTVAGSLIGGAIPDPAALGLDFALPAMFIGLLSGRLTDRRQSLVALTAVILAVAGCWILPGNWLVVAAASAAAAAWAVKA